MDIIIFEDDTNFSDYIKNIIAESSIDCRVALVTSDFNSLCSYIELLENPAIFILDIMFDNKSYGFKIADIISKKQLNALTVFVTSYPERILINSFYKIKAFNIILKTSRCFKDELLFTIQTAIEQITENHILIYKDKFRTISIKTDSIYYVETVKGKNKICIHHEKGRYEIKMSMSKLLSQLPDNFIRCHYSYIVNIKMIVSINHSTKSIKLENGDICYYSYGNWQRVINTLTAIYKKGVLKK